MKRTLAFTITFLIAALSAFSQSQDRTMLKLRLSDHSPISVNLDGRFIDQGTTQLILDGIRPGLHRVEVYSEGYRRHSVRIYTGTLRLEAGTVNAGTIDIYTRGLRLRTRELTAGDYAQKDNSSERQQEYPRDDRNSNATGDGRDYRGDDDDVYSGDRSGHNNRNDVDAPGSIEGQGSFPHGRENRSINRNPEFSQRDMGDLQSRVSSRITDSDKEELMKSVLQNRRFSTDQTRQMLHWLSFESTRLDFAKWAMPNVTDRDNYWKLEDAFDFSSSKKEFADAIRQ